MCTAPLRTCKKSMWPVMTRGLCHPRREFESCCASSAAMSFSSNQIGISIATVTLSFASMKCWSVSCRILSLPTAGMMRAAVSVAAFCLRFTMSATLSESGVGLRGARLGIVVSTEEVVWTCCLDALEKIRQVESSCRQCAYRSKQDLVDS